MLTGFSLDPIDTSGRKKSSQISINGLLEGMKEKVSTIDKVKSEFVQTSNDVEYLFVQSSNKIVQSKTIKELKVESWLDKLGIFQLNFQIALKDYKF